ncbi:MAG: hypothetical protein LLG01_00655 [Planctomycetaceae bacterium]|nr:hypothetical protein [Planctomycetaceae bacterium]
MKRYLLIAGLFAFGWGFFVGYEVREPVTFDVAAFTRDVQDTLDAFQH